MEYKFTTANFNSEVLEQKGLVLVDFWATWCGPCKMIAPIIEELATELDGKCKVGKVNVDEEGELASLHGIESIPTLALYENGKITLNQLYKNTSAVEWLEIEKIHVENVDHSENNRITLCIKGAKTQTVNVTLDCYQSYDNLSLGDSKEIELISGEETTVELAFGGFYNHTYKLSITIDNTRISLTIDPKDA